MSDLPLYLAAFVVVLAVLILFHELGHYCVARCCNVKVLRFSIGFGRVLWSRRLGKDGTEWVLSAFPLGGYVKMLDEREGVVVPEDLFRAFNRQGVGIRSMIVVAGPLANFTLAILLYWAVFMVGSSELRPLLGSPPEGTPAAVAGVRNGELARAVDKHAVETWNDLRWQLLRRAVDQETAELEVSNEKGEIAFRRISLGAAGDQGWEGDALERLGIRFFRPEMPPVIGKVVPDSPGAKVGLLPGDRVLSVDGQEVRFWFDLVTAIRTAPGKALHIEILRGDGVFFVEATPDSVTERGQSIGKLGIAVQENDDSRRELRTFVRHGFWDAGKFALAETWDKSIFSLVMLGKMLIGEVSWKNLSGPVTIADYAGQSAKLGLDYYIKFMALVSISLGVLNLLPIPVLDGGHLMYHMIEVVRRKPLSERAMGIGQQVGLSILFALMAFAFFNDLTRLLNG